MNCALLPGLQIATGQPCDQTALWSFLCRLLIMCFIAPSLYSIILKWNTSYIRDQIYVCIDCWLVTGNSMVNQNKKHHKIHGKSTRKKTTILKKKCNSRNGPWYIIYYNLLLLLFIIYLRMTPLLETGLLYKAYISNTKELPWDFGRYQ